MGPTAAILPDGARLHLQHGPIDLVIGVDGDRQTAFEATTDRFGSILQELVEELPELRRPLSPLSRKPQGETAQRMFAAVSNFKACGFVTPMAAVAGSVADTVLAAMVEAAEMGRAYVNNGGDIALHLAEGQSFSTLMQAHDGTTLGTVEIKHTDPVRGIATSGRHGRSLSLGAADSVTVLAKSAAEADVAATLVANAVDLPYHPAINRKPANEVVDDSDLGKLPVVVSCDAFSASERANALDAGERRASQFQNTGLIAGASLFLQGEARTVGHLNVQSRSLEHV